MIVLKSNVSKSLSNFALIKIIMIVVIIIKIMMMIIIITYASF